MTRYRLRGLKIPAAFHCRGNEEVSKGNEVNDLVPVEEGNPIFDDWNFLWKSCHQEETEETKHNNYRSCETGKHGEPNSSPSVYVEKNSFPKHGLPNRTAGISSTDTGAEYNLPPPSQLSTGNNPISRYDEYSVPPARCSAVPSGLVEQIRNGLFTNLTGIAAACEATTPNTSTETATTGSIEGDYRQKQAHKKTSYPFTSHNAAEQAVVGYNIKTDGGPERNNIPQPYTEYTSDDKAERHSQQYRPSHSLPVSYLFGETGNDQDNSHLYSYTVEEDIDIFDSNLTSNNNNNNSVLLKNGTGKHWEDKRNTSNVSEAAVFESKRTFDKQGSNGDGAFIDARISIKDNLERDDVKNTNCYRHEIRPYDDRKGGLEKAAGANCDLYFKGFAASVNNNNCIKNSTQSGEKFGVLPSFPTKDLYLEEKCVPDHVGKSAPVSPHHQLNRPTSELTDFIPASANSPGSNSLAPDKEAQRAGNYLCSKHSSGNNQSSSLSPQTKCNSLNITISDSWSYLPADLVAGSSGQNQTSISSTPNSPPYHISRAPPGTRRCSSARSTADRRRIKSPKSSRRSFRQSFKSKVLAALSPSKSKPRHSSCSSSISMGHGNRLRLDSKNSERGVGSKKGSQKDKSATVPTADFEWEATVAPCGKSNYIYSPHQYPQKNASNNQKSSQKKEKGNPEKMSNQEKTKSNGSGPSLKILSSLPNLVVANVRKLSKSSNDQPPSSSNSKKRNSMAASSSTDQFPLYPFQWHAFNNQSNHSFSTNDISQLSANHNLPVSANHSSAYINNNYEVTENVNFRQQNRQIEEVTRVTKDTKRYSWAVGDRDFDYLRYESDKFRNYAGGKYGGLLSHSPIREVDYECEEMLDKQQRMPLTSRSNNNNSGTSNNNHNNAATENWLQEQRERKSGACGNHTCLSSENGSRGSSNSAMIPGSRNVQYSSDVPSSCRRERDQKSRHSSNNSNASFNNYNNSPNINSNNHSSQNYHRYHQSQQNLPPNRINSNHNGSSNSHRMGRPHSVYVMNSDALENQIDPTRGGFNPGKFPLENNWNECNATPYTASQTLESPNNYAAVSSVGTESLNVTSIFGEGVDTVTSSAYSSFADRAESCATAADDLQSHNYRSRVNGGGGSSRGETAGHVMNAWNKEKATIIKLYEQKMAASEKRCRDLEEHYNNLCKTENPQMLREELRRKNSELSAAQNTIRNLSNVLSDKDAELLTLRDQMNSLNQEMQQQTLLIGQLHQKIADNQNSTNYYKAQLSQLQEELHKAFEETAQLKKEMEKLNNMSVNSFDQYAWGNDSSQSKQSVHEQQSGNKHVSPSSSSQQSSAQNDGMCGALSKKISQLERTLANVEQEKTNQLKVFERERVCWLEEKEIVLQYQKQLQANYAHIDNVNKQLQKQVDKQQQTGAQNQQQQHRQHYLQLQQHL